MKDSLNKMKKILPSIILGIFLISLIGAFSICVDKTSPSAPSNLAVTSSGQNLILNWPEAHDEPDCSEIDYYIISRDGTKIGEVEGNILRFTDTANLPVGSYNYTVFAIDRVGHNGGPAIKIEIKTAPSNGGNTPSGSRGNTIVVGGEAESSYVCYEDWQCSDWSECANGEQTRTCTDSAKCGTTLNKPVISQECKVETTSSRNFLTGAVTGVGNFVSSPVGIATGFGVIIILAGSIALVSFRKKRFSKKN